MRQTIAICGSMSFIDEMDYLAGRLRSMGHDVITPVREEAFIDWNNLPLAEAVRHKRAYVDFYLTVIKSSSAVLIANYDKHGVSGYIGANTLMEAAFAHALALPVFLLQDPGEQNCRLEILSIARAALGFDLANMLVL